jgi:hypothetical protein
LGVKSQEFFVADQSDLQALAALIGDCLESFGAVTVDVVKGKKAKSSQSMKGTWRMWMTETAEFMASQGVTMPLYIRRNGETYGTRAFNPQDAHELFMAQWGGVDASGDRYHQEKVGKGEMLHIMDKHLAWSIEKGINLTIPRDGEYMQLKQESEQ